MQTPGIENQFNQPLSVCVIPPPASARLCSSPPPPGSCFCDGEICSREEGQVWAGGKSCAAAQSGNAATQLGRNSTTNHKQLGFNCFIFFPPAVGMKQIPGGQRVTFFSASYFIINTPTTTCPFTHHRFRRTHLFSVLAKPGRTSSGCL